MAQRPNERRAERQTKSERNMNRAVLLLVAGLVAEWYLLMVDRYYARGTVNQFIKWYDFLGAMRWIGLAVLIAGVVLYVLREKGAWFGRLGGALAAVGVFFAFTSAVMRHVYPTSVTVMCILVPVLMVLGIVYLFYQTEFSVQATALALALGAIALLSRSGSSRVKACAVLALLGIAALLAGTFLLKKADGLLTLKGRKLRLFPANTDYSLTIGVPALCLALVLIGLFAPAVAFYAMWALAIVAFVLAVYYTVKLM